MDISKTTQPKSDQQNFDDYGTGGPKTVTITEVVEGTSEQPVWIHLAEFPGRPYKPSKSMRRVLEYAWGKDTDAYHGRSMTLYGDPTVKFGGSVLGGIKISHLSHIDREKSLSLTETKGKRKPFVVKPLETAPAQAPKRNLGDLFTAIGLTGTDARLAYCGRVTGRDDIGTSSDLTPADIELVMDTLERDIANEKDGA